jgi:pyruvate/2-oxoglutarate dehydrogenase complex dihydrolipoamide dehydrogenase (E3) component
VLPPAPQLEEEFEPNGIIEAAEALLRAGAPHDFEVLVIGGGCAGIAAARRAAELGASVGLVDAHLSATDGALDDPGRVPLDMVLDAWHEATMAQRTLNTLDDLVARENGTGSTSSSPQLNATSLWRRAALEAEKRRTARRRALEAAGVQVLDGRARFLDEHTVEVENGTRNERNAQKRSIRAVHIIVATGAGAKPKNPVFRGAEWAQVPSRESFEALLNTTSAPIAIIGRDSNAMEWAALLRASGAKVTLLRGDDTLWCDAAVRAGDDLLRESGVACTTLSPRLALQSEGETIRLRGAGQSAAHDRFSTVLWTDRAVDENALNLEAAGVEVEDGRIAVDARGETSVAGVYAAGGCAGFDCDAALAVAQGARLAETILHAPERIVPTQTPRRLRLVPELAAVGLSESDALSLDIAAHSIDGRWGKNRHLRLVVDESGFLLGCQACGDGAGDLVRQASVALKANWTAAHWARLLPETSAAPWIVALREAARRLGT